MPVAWNDATVGSRDVAAGDLSAPSDCRPRAFVERVYFSTQRWIIETLFEIYDPGNTVIIVEAGTAIGWMTVVRHSDHLELDGIYLEASNQGRGIGTLILRGLMT